VYETIAVNLASGEQRLDAYGTVNPAHELPTLEIDGLRLAQSLVILQYLDDRFSEKPLIPTSQPERAYALQMAEIINSAIHPLQNLRVLKKLEADFGFDETQKASWAKTFITQGFIGLEAQLARHAGEFALGDSFTIADCFIAPQVYNAHRFHVDMSPFPTLARIDAALLLHPAVATTHPSLQPDAPKS